MRCTIFKKDSKFFFITKLRTRLNDDVIDTLSFLRAHFQKERSEENFKFP